MGLNKKVDERVVLKNKCINYLNKKGHEEPDIKDNNWVKWCLGDTLFEEIKNVPYLSYLEK